MDIDRKLTATEAAALLGVTTRTLQNWTRAGWIEKAHRGTYSLSGVVRGAVAYHEAMLKRRQASPKAATTDARATEIELRTADRRAGLIRRDEVEAVIAEYAEMVRREFSKLPERLPGDEARRRALASELAASFRRIDAAADRARNELSTGRAS
jgi:hypothetical protein